MVISKDRLTTALHFPKVQGVVESKPINVLSKFKKFFTYRRKWEVIEDYIIWSEFLKSFILIPKSFPFDGASVPKVLHSALNSTGILLLGAGPHDFGYRYKCLILVHPLSGQIHCKKFNRKELDRIFESLCSRESGLPVVSKISKGVLRMFGSISWRAKRNIGNNAFADFPHLFIDKTDEE